MEFETQTNDDREIELDIDLINIYARHWLPNTRLLVSITRISVNSDPLRRAYFSGILRPFAESLGYDTHERMIFHDQLKGMFFDCEKDKFGVYRDVPHIFHAKKSKCSDDDKKKFMDWVVRLAASQGCIIQRRVRNESDYNNCHASSVYGNP